MLDDVERQPDVLTGLMTRAAEFRAAGQSLSGTGRIFVTSCGDGLFAAQAATLFAARQGLDWHPIGPLDFLVAADELRPSDRVIAISMSGNVDRTVEAATLADQRGLPIIALVNGAGGKLGALARHKISLDIPDIAPFLCGTASYTATLTALMLFVQGLAGRVNDDLAGLASVQAEILASSHRVVSSLTTETFSGVRLLAAGAESGTAAYGAAKLVELTRLPAWSGELEEFAHSQYWSMPASDLVVCISTHPTLADYAHESCKALAVLGVRTLAIDTAATPVETATWQITMPAVDPAMAPLASALPLQVLAYHLSQTSGLDPNTRVHLKNDETRFRVSRMLTRRSLLGTGL